jgi:hypothetical protein
MPRLATSRPAELAMPIASLAALRRALAAEVGPDAAARALLLAGHAAGDALYAALASRAAQGESADLSPADAGTDAPDPGASLAQVPQSVFWHHFADLFATRGWGRIAHEAVHGGVGSLESPDWAEADPTTGELRPSCFFTTGLLANLLGRVAGQEVAVLEVECRSRGDLRCRFLFGGAAALDSVYAALSEGRTVEEALAALDGAAPGAAG